jgi:hypothetical protein
MAGQQNKPSQAKQPVSTQGTSLLGWGLRAKVLTDIVQSLLDCCQDRALVLVRKLTASNHDVSHQITLSWGKPTTGLACRILTPNR